MFHWMKFLHYSSHHTHRQNFPSMLVHAHVQKINPCMDIWQMMHHDSAHNPDYLSNCLHTLLAMPTPTPWWKGTRRCAVFGGYCVFWWYTMHYTRLTAKFLAGHAQDHTSTHEHASTSSPIINHDGVLTAH